MKQKYLSVVLALALVLALAPATALTASAADIDLGGSSSPWTPIGASGRQFKGAFVFACDGGIDCPGDNYDDLDMAAWYHEYVDYALKNGLMSGMGNGKFGPGATLSRAMLAQLLYNHAGQPKVSGSSAFSDVAEGAWYENAVIWAAANGIVLGNGDRQFGPNDPITREELATMLWRAADEPTAAGDLSVYPDADGIHADWAGSAMTWAVQTGVIKGSGGKLNPRDNATRAEAAAMLMRFLAHSK